MLRSVFFPFSKFYLFITIPPFYSIFDLWICLRRELSTLTYTKIETSIRKVSNTARERRGEWSRRDEKEGKKNSGNSERSIRRSGRRRMKRRRRRRKKARSTSKHAAGKYFWSMERARARGQKSHSLISLVYGVAFCLINTLVVNYPYGAARARPLRSIRRAALRPIFFPSPILMAGHSPFARDTSDRVLVCLKHALKGVGFKRGDAPGPGDRCVSPRRLFISRCASHLF